MLNTVQVGILFFPKIALEATMPILSIPEVPASDFGRETTNTN
jgi:hypothetical protein